ncbi:sister chromatid cohesion protein DCC1-like isoform X2 [Oncorhynchus keta]|uniref:sister chromatid cohesion protein DCC1-like isoform X2 n=1 Tax=Oncorhynchus keta TaxID=8018 RepID=UPI00227BE2E3|nr:sister chromatid cohesion protein DCC1-like isoform X2 [Oncorhynchus keta]
MSRTLEEVQATIQIAKLKENDLQNTIHCLTFGESVSSGDYCLMELDDTLCKHIEAGKSLVIRGDQDERAVLCSEDKTYDLKIADTSNLLLLVPGCLTPDQLTTDNQASSQLVHAQIWGFSNSYWELRKRHPKLKKLKRLLMENPYEGPGISGQEDVTEGKVLINSTRLYPERLLMENLYQGPGISGQEDVTEGKVLINSTRLYPERLLMENLYEGPGISGQEDVTEGKVLINSTRLYPERLLMENLYQGPGISGQEDVTEGKVLINSTRLYPERLLMENLYEGPRYQWAGGCHGGEVHDGRPA